MSKESLTSINFNFSNGSNHSASTTSVYNAQDLDQSNSLGSVVGDLGGRVDFSNEKITKLFRNFILTEKTVSKDGTKTTISRKFTDFTSLRLKSHFIAVRGKDMAPNGSFNFKDIVYDYSELPESPVPSYGKQNPQKVGAALILGDVYNEITETNELTGEQFSFIYQRGIYQPLLSREPAGTSVPYYKAEPDFSKSTLRYGYKLSELRSVLAQAGIPVDGLPSHQNILFDNSGTAESVVSSIAGTLGMYWYVDPFTGTLQLINSLNAATFQITNPLQLDGDNIINCSHTTSKLTPVVATSYMTTTAPIRPSDGSGGGDENGNKQRIARFYPADILGNLDLNIPASTYKTYYGAFCASALDARAFDVLTFKKAASSKSSIDFGRFYSDFNPKSTKVKSFDELFIGDVTKKNALKAYEGPFDLENGSFISTKNINNKQGKLPSQTQAFNVIKAVFEMFNNTIYISNAYSESKARRVQWGSSDANISGPYALSTKLNLVEGFGKINALLKICGKDPNSLSLSNIKEASGATGVGDYVFIATKNGGESNTPTGETDYNNFSEQYMINYSDRFNRHFLAINKALYDGLDGVLANSASAFDKRLGSGDRKRTLRAPYTRAKKPVNDIMGTGKPNQDLEEDIDQKDAKESEAQSQITDLFDKKNLVESTFFLNGASGSPTSPATFVVKKGKGSEITALKQYGIQGFASNLQSSSRTLVGLHIPKFSIVITGITINLSSGGVTTTINESTQKVINMDDSVIISQSGSATRTSSLGRKFGAAQRNALGL